MATSILDINDSSFSSIIEENKKILIVFSAKWCGPCRMLTPLLEQIALDKGIKTPIGKVDIDASPKLATLMKIRAVPSIFYFKDGKAVVRFSEHVTYPNLFNFIKSNE